MTKSENGGKKNRKRPVLVTDLERKLEEARLHAAWLDAQLAELRRMGYEKIAVDGADMPERAMEIVRGFRGNMSREMERVRMEWERNKDFPERM